MEHSACLPQAGIGHGEAFMMHVGRTLGLSVIMKAEKSDEELEEAKELFKEGLRKILQATMKVSEKVVEGFREGYAIDVTKKESD